MLERAIDAGVKLLPEDEGKALLSSLGIGVPEGLRAQGLAEAEIAAEGLGFPLAIKVLAPGMAHKTEHGAVHLGIKDAVELRAVVRRLDEAFPGVPLLVERMMAGGVELIAGLLNDRHFGPCLMVGMGGVMAEVIDDVQFLLLPATRRDVECALVRLKGYRLLRGFRGTPEVDLGRLVDALCAIASFGMEAVGYYEAVDINPLLAGSKGVTALDVKVMLASGGDWSVDAHCSRSALPATFFEPPMPAAGRFTGFMAPRSVAIIGASAVEGKPGNTVIRNIQANGYSGALHLVNPNGGEILGIPVHRTIRELPGGVDLAVIIVPATSTPAVLAEVAAHGIKHVVLSAGGFAETDDQGAMIQQQLIDIIRDNRLNVLGPNTSGHVSVPCGFTSTFFPIGRIRLGDISYVAQTGNFATFTLKYILTGEKFGVSRVVGLGNKIDIEESQALEFLGDDPETRAIVAYIESIKYPRRFVEVARDITGKKPIVMLKGGSTEAGKQAASAHTAALASEDRIVDGILHQAGIVRVTEYSQLVMAGKALSMAPLPSGNRVSFLAPSGAMLVCLSDLAIRLGLSIPSLEQQTLQSIQEMSPPFIRIRNPVDIWGAATSVGIEAAYGRAIEAAFEDPNVDAVISVFMLTEETGIPDSYDFVVRIARQHPHKPLLVSFTGDKRYMDECRDTLEPQGIPTFDQIEEPFEALSILVRCAQVMRERASRG
jgi:acyl-CoA synthetase (NDP forming)